MKDFHTTSREILLFLEAELPEADKPEEQADDQAAEELPSPQADAPGGPETPVAPPPTPVESASMRECMYTDTILKALMFDYEKIPTKALVVFDMDNPEQILHFVQKIIGSKSDPQQFKPGEDSDPTAKSSAMLHRQKQVLAQMMLKALKYDAKQLTVNSSLATDKVTPKTAKELQKELSILLAV